MHLNLLTLFWFYSLNIIEIPQIVVKIVLQSYKWFQTTLKKVLKKVDFVRVNH